MRRAEANQVLHLNVYSVRRAVSQCGPRGTSGERAPGVVWSGAELKCRGGTHNGAGVDVIGVGLAVLHFQGDSGVIVWKQTTSLGGLRVHIYHCT